MKEMACFIQARKMQVLLEDLMATLQHASEDIQMQVLLVLRNVLGHVMGEEASPIALQLVEKLLPLFNDVRLLQDPEPRRRARCKESCPSAQPCGQPSGRAAPLLAPPGSAALIST